MKKFLLIFFSLIFFLLLPSPAHAFSGTFQVTGGYIGTAYGAHVIGGAFSQDASIQCNIGDSRSRFYDALTSNPVGTSWDSCQFSTPGVSVGVYSRDLPDGEYYVVLADFAGNTWTSQIFTIVNNQIVVLAPNQSPTVNPIPNATLNEGDAYLANDSFTDPDSTSWTATVDYGDGTVLPLTLSGTSFSLSHLYKDNGIYTVQVLVTDNQGAIGEATATVTVNNVAPSVGLITAPSSVAVNTSFTASANFIDAGVLDTHTASWNWGDGSTTGTVIESNGSGSVSNTHTYATAGTYTIALIVTDKDNVSGQNSTSIGVINQLIALSPAKVWVGLKNISNIGAKFDLKAEVYKDNTLISSGQINSFFPGLTGLFASAKLATIPFNSFSPTDFPSGSSLKVKVYVRNACTGSARFLADAKLWFNDSQADSHFDATIGITNSNYYLINNSILSTSVGVGPKVTVTSPAGLRCSPFKQFGTWSMIP